MQNINWRHKDLVAKGWPRVDLGWRCGDINYYEFIQRNSGYDFVWMCEPDVSFHQIEASQFFKKYETEKADFLAVNIEKRKKSGIGIGIVQLFPEKYMDAFLPYQAFISCNTLQESSVGA